METRGILSNQKYNGQNLKSKIEPSSCPFPCLPATQSICQQSQAGTLSLGNRGPKPS